MFFQLSLCFLLLFTGFLQNSSYSLRGKNHYGTRFIFGGKPFLQTGQQSVVNGKLNKKKMIEVVIQINQDDEDDSLCGGTIIGDRYILTAAHCFVPSSLCFEGAESQIRELILPLSKINVYIEGLCHNFDDDEECAEADSGRLVSAKTFYILEEYYAKNNCTSGDLAIIELSEVIGDHGATLSDSHELPISGDFIVSGFGEDPANPSDTGHRLKSVTLTAQKCIKGRARYDSICTIEIEKDACAGDSGGALVTKDDIIIGVVSGGAPCSLLHSATIKRRSENKPLKKFPGGIFTSTSMHRGFICDIVDSLKGCPKTFYTESYLTIIS